MKKVLAALAVIALVTGCASSSSDYYEAVQKTAEANARAHQAKMTALAQMAASGDPSAQGAAVMAMALTQAPVVTPQYVEPAALSWARVLAGPTAAVAGLYLQTDLAKHQSDNTAMVQMGQQQVQMNSDALNSQTVLGVAGTFGDAAAAGGTAVANVATAGFNALNAAGDQTVTVSRVGFETAEQVVGRAFRSVDTSTTTGYQTVEQIVGEYTQSLTTIATQTPTVVDPVILNPEIVTVPSP